MARHDGVRGWGVGIAALLAGVAVSGDALAQADTLRVGIGIFPPSRGVPHSASGGLTNNVYSTIFDPLVQINEKGDLIPALATKWESVSPTKWRFTIKSGVKFSNGEALTAQSIDGNIKWFQTDEGKATIAGRTITRLITASHVIDAQTIEFDSAGPNPALPAYIFSVLFFEPKALKEMGTEAFANAPVGTGPFKVERWRPEALELVSNDGSWRTAKLKKITITALPEMTARVQALLSGQVDIIPAMSVDAIKQVQAAGMKAEMYPAPYAQAWGLINMHRDTPFKDVRVRRAANLAVNKDAMVQNLLMGRSAPISQGAVPGTFGYNPDVKPYPHDPEQAKKLLAEAGYPNGFDMEAYVIPNNFPADADIYQAAAQDLAKVGIRVTLKGVTFPEWAKIVLAADAQNKDFLKEWGPKVMAYQQDFAVDIVPDASRQIINSWGCQRVLGPWYCDKEEDELLNKAQAEFDVDKRRKLLQELMAKNRDNAPGLFLTQLVDVVGHSAKVQNAKMVYRVLNYDDMSKTN